MTAQTLRRRDLATIHLGKKALGLDDDTYRDMLYTVTRKRSSADLDAHERGLVISHLVSRGFQPKPAKPDTPAPARVAKAPPQVRFIYALWALLARNGAVQDKSPSALRAWIRHYGQDHKAEVGEGAPEMLPQQIRHRIAEYLIQWCARLGIEVKAVPRTHAAPKKRGRTHR